MTTKKYNFVYETTQLSTGKRYIGKHSTDNLDDGYMGSGVDIHPLLKADKNDFECRIIEHCSSSAEAFKREGEILSPEYLANNWDNLFNRCPGGNISRHSIYMWSKWKPGMKLPKTTYGFSVDYKNIRLSIDSNMNYSISGGDFIIHEGNSHKELIKCFNSKTQSKDYQNARLYVKDHGQGKYFRVLDKETNKISYITVKDDRMIVFSRPCKNAPYETVEIPFGTTFEITTSVNGVEELLDFDNLNKFSKEELFELVTKEDLIKLIISKSNR